VQGTGSPVAQGFKWSVQSKGLADTFNLYHTIFADALGPSTSLLVNPSADGTVDGTLMPEQKVAIGLVGNWVASWWIKGGPAPWPGGIKAYRVAPLPTQDGQAPGFATQATGSTFVLTCASKHRRLAAELIEMAKSKSFNTKHVIWTGEAPPREDVLHSAAYVNSVPYFNNAESSWIKYADFTSSYTITLPMPLASAGDRGHCRPGNGRRRGAAAVPAVHDAGYRACGRQDPWPGNDGPGWFRYSRSA
jgi:ABC-type glycerol-3-phosphate transport system substrate-binding protein